MSVGRICTKEVAVALASETVRSTATFMSQQQVGSLVVLSDDKKPIGILSDRDLVTRVLAEGKDPDRTRVDEVMTTDPKTIREDAPIEEVISIMRGGGFRRVPVVDSDDQLFGLVTLDDVLGLLAGELSLIGDIISQQTPHIVDES